MQAVEDDQACSKAKGCFRLCRQLPQKCFQHPHRLYLIPGLTMMMMTMRIMMMITSMMMMMMMCHPQYPVLHNQTNLMRLIS